MIVDVGNTIAQPSRPMDLKKDLVVYGYGIVSWKEWMKEWKKKPNDKIQVIKTEGKMMMNWMILICPSMCYYIIL